jgi:hypothetical protein
LRDLGDDKFPKSNDAHIVTRLEDLLPDRGAA